MSVCARFKLAATIAIVVLTLASCRSSDGSANSSANATVHLWVGWSDREFAALKTVLAGFEKTHPGITVDAVPGQGDDAKLTQAVAAGQGPDLTTIPTTDDLGQLCSRGVLSDLAKYEDRYHVTASQFPSPLRPSLSFEGRRCAIPYLTDTLELYYNTDLLKQAGFDHPPRTVSELVTMAVRLTQFNADGSIKVAGFVPLLNFYENYIPNLSSWFDAPYVDSTGHAALAGNPGWTDLLTFQKELIDKLGYDKLHAFVAGAGAEGSAANAFETGHLAMVLDGEWRTKFIADEHPSLHYATAPMPAPAGQPDEAGSSRIGLGLLAIPKGAKHPDQAWQLARYLALNTGPLVAFANAIHNVPTTTAALTSPSLNLGLNEQPFLAALRNPHSSFPAVLKGGPVYYDPVNAFVEKWQAGKVPDLNAGLRALDTQIDGYIAQS